MIFRYKMRYMPFARETAASPGFFVLRFLCDRCISLLEQPDSGEIHVGWSEPFDTRQRTASPAPAENRQDLSALQSVEQKTY